MYEDITPETIKAGILSKFDLWDTQTGSFAYDLIAPTAEAIWEYYMQLESIPSIVFPDENSGFWIDRHCADYGIERKPGGKAKGTITFTGKSGTTIPAGKIFLTEEGLRYQLTAAVTIGETGTASGTLEAVSEGATYNVPANNVTVQETALNGLTAWSTGEMAGGYDEESDASLVARYYDRLRTPATSGNVYHYLQWAKEVAGVGAAKVYPLWDGAGTVKVVLAGDGYTVPSAEVVKNAEAHIKESAPIGADVTVVAGTKKDVAISASVILRTGTDISAVKNAFTKKAAEYLLSLAFSVDTEVILTVVGRLLSEIDGVKDYTNLTINGAAENLSISETDIPTLGEVTLHAAT